MCSIYVFEGIDLRAQDINFADWNMWFDVGWGELIFNQAKDCVRCILIDWIVYRKHKSLWDTLK